MRIRNGKSILYWRCHNEEVGKNVGKVKIRGVSDSKANGKYNEMATESLCHSRLQCVGERGTWRGHLLCSGQLLLRSSDLLCFENNRNSR